MSLFYLNFSVKNALIILTIIYHSTGQGTFASLPDWKEAPIHTDM